VKTIALLKEMLASLGKFTITGDFAQGHRLLNVFQFVACEVGFIEGDSNGFQIYEVRGKGL
jgi:ABC-type thiamin/hydroxymethylpyrimidine transport system permease subunit